MTARTLIGTIAAALLLACAAPALGAERMAVADIKPLLVRAIEHGEAHGVLGGEAATFMQQRFDTAAPIEIDARLLHALPQTGCHRLEVTTRQRGVLEQGSRQDKALTYQVSFCRDGRFPEKP